MKRFERIGAAGAAMLWGIAAAAAEPETPQRLRTFRQVIEAGGVTMIVIIVLSVLATFLVLFFLLTLRAGVLCPKSFVQEAEDAAAAGDAEALQAVCENSGSPAARVVGAALEQYIGGGGEADYLLMKQAMEDEGARQASILWQRIQYLLDIAVVAPMVGLLGTVLGMLQSFAGLQLEVGAVKPVALAHGVAKALVTTAGGLIVGIAAMILYALFRGRVNKLIGVLEVTSGRILRLFSAAQKTAGSR